MDDKPALFNDNLVLYFFALLQVNVLYTVGGADARDTVDRCIYKLLTNDMQRRTNRSGRGDKLAFANVLEGLEQMTVAKPANSDDDDHDTNKRLHTSSCALFCLLIIL